MYVYKSIHSNLAYEQEGNTQAQSQADVSAWLLDHDWFVSHPLSNTAEQRFHFKLHTFIP